MAEPDASVATLLKELRNEMQRLVREEIALARAEAREKIRLTLRRSIWAAIGLVLVLGGTIEVLVLLNTGLATWLDQGMALAVAVWLAPLLLAVVLLAVGGIVLNRALHRIKTDTRPERTVQSLRDTKRWATRKARAQRRMS